MGRPAGRTRTRRTRLAGRQVGALIGAIAGLVFVLINAGAAAGPWAWVLRGLGIVAFAGVLWVSVLRRERVPADQPPPSASAWRVYWVMVAFEVVLLPVGVKLLVRLDHPELTVPWVALIVGVHFLPFARAFEAPVFRVLGLVLIGLAVVGGVLGLRAGADVATLVAGIGSGIALLAFAFHVRPRLPVHE